MKSRDIAAKYGIDRLLFEHFLKDNALPHQIGFLSVSVCDDNVIPYVEAFLDWKEHEDEKQRILLEQERKRREEEAARAEAERKRLAEEARLKAAEEARRRKQLEAERWERINAAEAEYAEQQRIELEHLAKQTGVQNLNERTEEERKKIIMANSVKLNKEKLIGNWEVNGATYANNDILGLWLNKISYSGVDGQEQQGFTDAINKTFTYSVYVIGDETGKCMLMIKGNPNGYCATLGEMAFSEDANYLALRCPDSNFLLKRV